MTETIQAEKKAVGILGITTEENAVAQLDGLLSYFVDLAGIFPEAVKKISTERWRQVAGYGKDKIASGVESDLIRRLHESCKHPDWEYTSTEAQYKGGYDKEPEGHGWVSNIEKDRGCTRDDPVEYQHYRRLKSDALKDDIQLRDLPAPQPAKIKLEGWINVLRGKISNKFMPNSTSHRHGAHAEVYTATDLNEILEVQHHNGLYIVGEDHELRMRVREESKTLFRNEHFLVDGLGSPNIIFAYEEGLPNGMAFRVLTNLLTEKTYVTARRRDRTWQGWEEWYDFSSLPVDITHLIEVLES